MSFNVNFGGAIDESGGGYDDYSGGDSLSLDMFSPGGYGEGDSRDTWAWDGNDGFSSGQDIFSLEDVFNYNPFSDTQSLLNDYRETISPDTAAYEMSPTSESDDKGNEFLRKYKETVAPFQGILKNPIVSTLMSLHPASALLKTVLGGPNSVGGFLGSLVGTTPIGKIAGAFGGSQLANYATEGKFVPVNGQMAGSLIGTGLGAYSDVPFGAALGNQLGQQLGKAYDNGGFNQPGNSSGFMPSQQSGVNGMDFSGFVPMSSGLNNSLLGAIAGGGLAANNNRTLNGQINTLEGLFGQNSPYAQQMRKSLERRDAASGRRSQYGPREVELQAALAGNAAKLQPGLQQLYSQKMGNTNLAVQSLLRNPNILNGIGSGMGWLGNLFNSNSAPATSSYYNEPDNSGFEFTGGGA